MSPFAQKCCVQMEISHKRWSITLKRWAIWFFAKVGPIALTFWNNWLIKLCRTCEPIFLRILESILMLKIPSYPFVAVCWKQLKINNFIVRLRIKLSSKLLLGVFGYVESKSGIFFTVSILGINRKRIKKFRIRPSPSFCPVCSLVHCRFFLKCFYIVGLHWSIGEHKQYK